MLLPPRIATALAAGLMGTADRIKLDAAISGGQFRHYKSAPGAERYATIPVTKSGATHWVIYSLALGDLKPGEIVLAYGDVSGANALGYNIMFGHQLRIATGPTSTSGLEVTELLGDNIEPADARLCKTAVGVYAVEDFLPDRFLNLQINTGSTAALSGHRMTINASSGQVGAIIF